MKAPLNSSIRASGCASSAAMNCGRKARKKIDSFGLRMLIRMPVTITRRLERAEAAGRVSTASAPGLAQRLPGHVEQIDHAAPFQRGERQRAGVQHRGEPEHGGQHLRHDPERAAERRRDAGPRAACQRRRQRVEHAGAGRGDHDQRGQQEGQCHALALSRRRPAGSSGGAAAHERGRASSPRRLSCTICSASRMTSSGAQGLGQNWRRPADPAAAACPR